MLPICSLACLGPASGAGRGACEKVRVHLQPHPLSSLEARTGLAHTHVGAPGAPRSGRGSVGTAGFRRDVLGPLSWPVGSKGVLEPLLLCVSRPLPPPPVPTPVPLPEPVGDRAPRTPELMGYAGPAWHKRKGGLRPPWRAPTPVQAEVSGRCWGPRSGEHGHQKGHQRRGANLPRQPPRNLGAPPAAWAGAQGSLGCTRQLPVQRN